MKICFIITRGDLRGGAQTHVCSLVTALARRNIVSTILCGMGTKGFDDLRNHHGVSVQMVKSLIRDLNPIADLAAVAQLVKLIRRENPAIVSTHTAKAGVLGRLAAYASGKPVMHTPHGWSFGPRSSPRLRPFYRLIERSMVPFTSRFLMVCRAEAEMAYAGLHIPVDLAKVIYNTPSLRPPEAPESQHEQANSRCVRLLMVARYVPPKDPFTVINALSRLKTKNWEMRFLGSGRQQAEMKKLVEKYGIGERVTFSPEVTNVTPFIDKSDVLILSSFSEAFPQSILEAFSRAKPVIASDVGGIGEIVDDGVNGFLVPPADAAVLADRIDTLIASEARRRQMGMSGLELIRESFRPEAMIDQYVQVYDEVLAGRHGRVPAHDRRHAETKGTNRAGSLAR